MLEAGETYFRTCDLCRNPCTNVSYVQVGNAGRHVVYGCLRCYVYKTVRLFC